MEVRAGYGRSGAGFAMWRAAISFKRIKRNTTSASPRKSLTVFQRTYEKQAYTLTDRGTSLAYATKHMSTAPLCDDAPE